MQYLYEQNKKTMIISFNTKLQNSEIDIYNLSKFKKELNDDYDHECTAQIDWEFSFEVRSWGVKNWFIDVINVDLEIELEWWNDDETESNETISINSSDGWSIEIDDTDFFNHGAIYSIYLKNLEADFKTKTLTIYI